MDNSDAVGEIIVAANKVVTESLEIADTLTSIVSMMQIPQRETNKRLIRLSRAISGFIDAENNYKQLESQK